MNEQLTALIQAYRDSGHCVTIYPRKKIVVLNGFRYLTYAQAITYLKEAI